MYIAVYCGSVSGNQEIYTEKAALFGRWMAEQGHVLIYGGAQGGLMGAVSNAVLENGGKSSVCFQQWNPFRSGVIRD